VTTLHAFVAVLLAINIAFALVVVLFLTLAVLLGSAFSIAAVALEELSFRRYHRFRDLMYLLGIALIESFGYRQLSAVWRLRGLVEAMRGDTAWGEMERTGFDRETAEVVHPS
jgi:hypothetical protein